MAFDFDSWKENMAQQQAQFWADLRALEARQAEDRQHIARLVDVCMSLTSHVEETNRGLREFGKETDRRIRELVEAQAETHERLDVLVSVVDALVKRNGRHN
jgi:septal ring factor EnvC (AmiA/AmiB activator)